MQRAQLREAVTNQKFWFRTNVLARDCDGGDNSAELSCDEIINGKVGSFVGLLGLVKKYISSLDLDTDTACTLNQYLRLISDRAAGKAKTAASWIREFVMSHPEYKQDSRVTDGITYDLLLRCHEISSGGAECPALLGGTPKTRTQEDIPK